jgi:hypothetical protein
MPASGPLAADHARLTLHLKISDHSSLGDGDGGCIARDRNEEEECFSTCSHEPTNGAEWPDEGRDWCGGMEEAALWLTHLLSRGRAPNSRRMLMTN